MLNKSNSIAAARPAVRIVARQVAPLEAAVTAVLADAPGVDLVTDAMSMPRASALPMARTRPHVSVRFRVR